MSVAAWLWVILNRDVRCCAWVSECQNIYEGFNYTYRKIIIQNLDTVLGAVDSFNPVTGSYSPATDTGTAKSDSSFRHIMY